MKNLSSNTVKRVHYGVTIIGVILLVLIYFLGTGIQAEQLQRIEKLERKQDTLVASENKQWDYLQWQANFNAAINDSLDIVATKKDSTLQKPVK